MEGHHPRVAKVDSVESWNSFVNQAKNKSSPIIVHFTASWCMPSVAMNPFFEEVASAYPDVMFLSVDVDEVKADVISDRLIYFIPEDKLPEVASKLEVKAMPTFLLMKDGAVVDKIVGANPEEVRRRIDTFVQVDRVYVA